MNNQSIKWDEITVDEFEEFVKKAHEEIMEEFMNEFNKSIKYIGNLE
jgi:hypothetical protein